MPVPPQEFTCASCTSSIHVYDPRVRCLVCKDNYDMCATCVLGERFKEPHLGTHAVMVLKQSGCRAGGGGRGGSSGDGRVPTILGTTAICYYAPQPPPTLPVVSAERANNSVLVSRVEQLDLSLAPESESVSEGNTSTGRDEIQHNYIVTPPSAHPMAVATSERQQLHDAVTRIFAENHTASAMQNADSPSPHSFSQQVPQTLPVNIAKPICQNISPISSPHPNSPLEIPNRLSGPPPVPPRRPTAARTTSSNSPFPVPCATPTLQQNGYQEPSATGSTGWRPFFRADMSPSPSFITLMDDVFTYLDPQNHGNLEPDIFSRFLDDLGFATHENTCE